MRLATKILVLLVLFSHVAARAAKDDPCQIKGVQFAHCPNASRDFYSALVAVHGWNGSCAETFGHQDASLYRILEKHKFYDWDCFQYDSRHLSITENARLLRVHLQDLKRAGYQQVLLTTHSTGGILALELLADGFKSPNPAPDQFPRISGILAWATPINGLRSLISGGGAVLSRAGFSPKTLPDLKEDSPYLKALKARLKDYNRKYLAADPVTQGKLGVKVWFLQGQGDDMVVQPISRSTAEAEGWYWPDRESLIETGEGHTHNVGAAGTRLVPRYPAAILDTRAVLALRVNPRYDDVFPEKILAVPAALESRQIDVVNGLTYFADEKFTDAFTPSLAFLKRMFQGSFERSRVVDEKLVFGFLDLLKRKAGNPDDDLVRFFDSFTRDVLVGYNPALGQDIRTLGHGNSRIAQAILETAEIIRQSVNDYIRKNPESGRLLASSGGLDAFNTRLVGFSAKFLDSPHGPVQYAALSTLDSSLPGLPDGVVTTSGAVGKLNAYYIKGGYRNLSVDAKSKIQRLYGNLGARGQTIQTAVFETLTAKVPYRGSQQPSWVALADDKTIRDLLATIEARPDAKSPEKLRFAAGVAARAGATGTDVKAALKAIDVGKDIIARTQNTAARAEFETVLRQGVARSAYPVVQQSYPPQ